MHNREAIQEKIKANISSLLLQNAQFFVILKDMDRSVATRKSDYEALIADTEAEERDKSKIIISTIPLPTALITLKNARQVKRRIEDNNAAILELARTLDAE